MKFLDRIKHEFFILGDTTKVLLRVLFYIFILTLIYKFLLPVIKYHLPKGLKIQEYENISGFVIIGLVWLAVIIGRIIESSFKNNKK